MDIKIGPFKGDFHKDEGTRPWEPGRAAEKADGTRNEGDLRNQARPPRPNRTSKPNGRPTDKPARNPARTPHTPRAIRQQSALPQDSVQIDGVTVVCATSETGVRHSLIDLVA
ncbi:MAG: hypothetical protein AB1758_12825 [Candidatus Eremiobacterota bacterium]